MSAKTILLAEVVAKSLSNPGVRKEYEALAEEFQVAQLIIDMRKAAKLTQQELADLTGIKQPQLARIEAGGQLPRLDTLTNLAKEAGYSVEIHLIPQSQHPENGEILTPLSLTIST
ncbi:MAG: helix-turn-helix transcriptional regulator [Nostocaceae cyanobacterium]|nr:helix-turn-helix transcriptional regulator [Nostocaceae cyanobacterium]